ncbi:branched-chain amino acid ABC transporter permease [Microbaculum marinum]|uniref:Branched-chain amino acid ABC transporter permease n=1 Tax=Microbaculum marinum TaxID=1764581 RepID=A0AAW9S3S5_9HYPH
MSSAETAAVTARRMPSLSMPVLLAVCYVALPFVLGNSFWLQVSVYAGIAAIGAIGLNLLTGNTGQVSLGHPFFLGAGAYAAGVFGQDWGLPFWIWLPGAGLVGFGLGALVGPFALRLRGNYLVMVTFALVFIGLHIFSNWSAVTGGAAGRGISVPVAIGPIDFADLFGATRDQCYFWLVWGIVGISAWLVFNIINSRPGRALMAIRDRELTAEFVGIDVSHMKIAAFAISSAVAAVAGALYGAYVQYVSPVEWNLLLGIQYIAMIIVGGIGSVAGGVIGAVVITFLPHLMREVAGSLPFVAVNQSDGGLITVFALNQILFGVLIVFFLVVAPGGLARAVSAAAGRLSAPRRHK